jgi:excisionase family DNA binding protein
MRSRDAGEEPSGGVPEMLTVPEAARRLRIGRTLAYQLAARFLEGEPGGIPTIRLGGTLRVPRAALDELMRLGSVVTPDDMSTAAAAVIDDLLDDGHAPGRSSTRSARPRRAATRTAQLSLLEAD